MKKIFLILLTMCLFLCGCDNTIYHWEFKKPVSEVQEISIIYIDGYSSNEVINTQPIKIIESSEYKNFYNEIQSLQMKKLFKMEFDTPNNYCFLIRYDNEHYCILSVLGSGYIEPYEDGTILTLYWEKLDFNREDFENLINKYLNS